MTASNYRPDCGVNACACEMKNQNFVHLNYPDTPIYLVVKWMPVLVRWKITILFIWIILTLQYTWFGSEYLCWWDKKSQFCLSELSSRSNIPGCEVNACEMKNHNFVHLNYPHNPIYHHKPSVCPHTHHSWKKWFLNKSLTSAEFFF